MLKFSVSVIEILDFDEDMGKKYYVNNLVESKDLNVSKLYSSIAKLQMNWRYLKQVKELF